MRFVTRVRINDFRSISEADVDDLEDVVPLVGLNGSGKSNFLRALNLFFNDRLEGDEALNLRRDFREPGRKAKLRIAVEVELDYSVFDSLRPEYQEALDRLSEGFPVITIKKEWTLHPITREQVTSFHAGPLSDETKELEPDVIPYVSRLLNSVRFRYIPNHIHPTAILRAESEGIRKLLFDRLGQSGVLSGRAVKQIAAEAAQMMQPIGESLGKATGDIGAVELATPSDWRELAWAFGLRLQATQAQPFETS
jgi:hypothetical protein